MQSAGAAEELQPGGGNNPSEQVMLSSGAIAVSQQHAGSRADVSSWLNAQQRRDTCLPYRGSAGADFYGASLPGNFRHTRWNTVSEQPG